MLGLGLDLLVVDTAHVVPGLALTAGSSLNCCIPYFLKFLFNYSFVIYYYLHGVVDGVLCVVLIVFVLVEDTGGAVKLELDLGGQSALKVDNPQGLVLANEDALDLLCVGFRLGAL